MIASGSTDLSRGRGLAVLAVLTAVLAAAVLVTAAPARPAAVSAPAISLAVGGSGAELRPGFDPAITRYGVAATESTAGTITVSATASEPGATVRVDGRAVTGATTVSGLEAGDEVSVIVTDSVGVHPYALVYLPPSFPVINEAVPEAQGTVSEGAVLLTMGVFAMALDRHGVPLLLRDLGRTTSDLKPAPHGHYTVLVRRPGGASDWDLVELDGRFDPVRTSRAVGLSNTDNHDVILEADGTRYFVAYEPDAETDLIDPVIQQVDAAGNVVYTWDGGDHLDVAESTAGSAADWAHINSIQVLPDGDLLASFRHLSSIVKIAWSDHDGFTRGDVVWRLGGRRSDFTFPDDPHAGTCAQHTAAVLPNGNLLVYDNGSGALGALPSYCVDPGDPAGATVNRAFTRVVEYALDEDAMTATLVNDWRHDRFSYFAGSARRLASGNTLISWASEPRALVSELDAAGETVWELVAPQPPNPQFTLSYRAEKAVVPDTLAPEVHLTLPGAGRYELGDHVVPDVRCTDAGGSTLRSCDSTAVATNTVGTWSHLATATDGAGHRTTVRRTYTVVPSGPRIRVNDAGRWRAKDRIRLRRPGATHRSVLQVTNGGVHPRSLAVLASRPGGSYRMRYRFAGKDVTAAVRSGTFRTPVLASGQAARLVVTVKRRRGVAPEVARLRVRAVVPASSSTTGAVDEVTLVLRGR